MACYRGWVGGGGEWKAGGGLIPPLELFGLAIEPAIGPNMLEWCNRHLPITEVNFRSMPSV